MNVEFVSTLGAPLRVIHHATLTIHHSASCGCMYRRVMAFDFDGTLAVKGIAALSS